MADSLCGYLQVLVRKLDDCGLFVQCLVCDQGSTNEAALRKLGFSPEHPYAQLSDREIHVIFDVPHVYA